MSIVDDIARLVLKNPNISAREIAQVLGYAEQKSVYYWLRKAGFKGMRDFRQEVLSRNFFVDTGTVDAPVARDQDSTESLPSKLGQYLAEHLDPGSLLVLLSRDSGHIASSGDVAVADPKAPESQGDLVAARIEGSTGIARRYLTPGDPIFVDPADPKITLLPEYIIGKVVLVVRRLL